MNKQVLAVVIIAMGLSVPVMASDDQARRCLVQSALTIDNPARSEAFFSQALDYCEGETNRFAAILVELSRTNDLRIAKSMIMSLGYYGSREQLPFLYAQAGNAALGYESLKSAMEIEGVTTNTVTSMREFLALEDAKSQVRADLCETILCKSTEANVASNVVDEVRSAVVDYARMENLCVISVDEALCNADPTYVHSRRRLSVLRSVYALGVRACLTNYVQSAIGALVAYPESNLQD